MAERRCRAQVDETLNSMIQKRDEQFYDFIEIFYKFVINRN